MEPAVAADKMLEIFGSNVEVSDHSYAHKVEMIKMYSDLCAPFTV